MANFFIGLYDFFKKRRIIFILFNLSFLAVFVYFGLHLVFEEDITKSVSGSNEDIETLIKHSKITNKLILNIYCKDTLAASDNSQMKVFANELDDSLKDKTFTPYISKLTCNVNDSIMDVMYNIFLNNLPVFLDETDYKKIDTILLSSSIKNVLEKNYNTLLSPAGFALKKYIMKDPVGISSLALKKLKQFQFDDAYEIQDGYIFTKNKKHLLIFIDPVHAASETAVNTVFVNKLEYLLNKLNAKNHEKIIAEYYGASAVAVGNATQIKKDIAVTVTIAILIILVFIGWFFRNSIIPFISFLPALFGGGLALTILFLIKTSVSTIALGIGSVLLGIIVDYALYFFSLHKAKGSVKEVLKDLSLTIFLCSLTTAVAFFSLLFVQSEVLRDLGLFAGISILGAALFSLVILPHMVKKNNATSQLKPRTIIEKITGFKYESNAIILFFILIITIISLFTYRKAGFEKDMYAMNYLSDKLRTAENHLNEINRVSLKSVFVVTSGKNTEEALSLNAVVIPVLERLKDKKIIQQFTNINSILITDSLNKARIRRWENYWTLEKKRAFINNLKKSSSEIGFKQGAFNDFYSLFDKKFQPISHEDLNKLCQTLLNDMVSETKGNTTIITMIKVNDSDREKVFSAFIGMKNIKVIDKQKITSEFVETIKKDFELLVNLCLIFVTLFLIISFGRIELGLIASLPMFISWLWTLGIMGLTGLKFNIFNILISTFVFGLGVDYSILMMRGLLLEYKYARKELTSYKTSIFLSAFTTIVGVGVLAFAKHPSLYSIAALSIIGMISVVLISYSIVPIIFRWLIDKNKKRRHMPLTFSDLIFTIFYFINTFCCCILLNVSLFVVVILPLPMKRKKLIMHYIIMYICRIIVYTAGNIKKKIIKLPEEDFSKPAVIISNHQSHLDLILLIMLHPKIIVITNKWVWQNPFYGLVLRFLEYFPIMDGYENIMNKLDVKVKEGFSILIFPEGSRSETSHINRFHKGAFVIAEQLAIDILPVMIHGAGDCMTKGENHLKSGSITIKIFNRISPENIDFGNDYHARTKSVLKFFRHEFSVMNNELGTPDYYKRKLIRNYIYKGPVLEWYLRVKIKLEKNYNFFNHYIPKQADILDVGCGYGFLSYMLHFVSDQRTITALDYDERKIETAANCFSKDKTINFVYADALEYTFSQYDVIILSDILHYLPENKQEALMIKCIEHLKKEGMIIIRDGDKDLEKRHLGTLYTEFFSTKFFKFNKTIDNKLSFFSGNQIKELVQRFNLNLEIIDNSKLTSNIFYIITENKNAKN